MMDASSALAIAARAVAREEAESGVALLLDRSATEDRGWCCVFYYTRNFLVDGDDREQLAGNGPIVVVKQSGTVHRLRTGHPIEDQLADLHRQVREGRGAVSVDGPTKRRLIRIGYWGDGGIGDYPDPRRLINESINRTQRETVIDYLASATVARSYLGAASCRLCGDTIGSTELSDGTYLWPEGLAHYIARHGVWLPEDFLDHVEARLQELEEADVDDEWWRALSPAGDQSRENRR